MSDSVVCLNGKRSRSILKARSSRVTRQDEQTGQREGCDTPVLSDERAGRRAGRAANGGENRQNGRTGEHGQRAPRQQPVIGLWPRTASARGCPWQISPRAVPVSVGMVANPHLQIGQRFAPTARRNWRRTAKAARPLPSPSAASSARHSRASAVQADARLEAARTKHSRLPGADIIEQAIAARCTPPDAETARSR